MRINIADMQFYIKNMPLHITNCMYYQIVISKFGSTTHIKNCINIELCDFSMPVVNFEKRNLSDYYEFENTFLIKSPFFDLQYNFKDRIGKLKISCNENQFFYIMKALKIIVSYEVIACNGIPLHSSAVIKNNKGIAFCGESGAGKTTISLIFSKTGIPILNDEFNIIIPCDNEIFLYSTPFTSEFKMQYCNNKSARLTNIFILNKSDFNTIKATNVKKAFFSILKNIHTFPTTLNSGNQLLSNIESICMKIMPKELYFIDNDSVTTLF